MKRMKVKVFLILFLFTGLLSCNHQQENDKPVITVSILPQKYFVEQITGDHFTINVMIPPGASPVTYEPSPKQMKELTASDVYFRIGHIEFEKSWMDKLKNIHPDMEIIDLSTNANLISPDKGHDLHAHNDHHHHHGTDPHIWTSPKEVKKQVELIYRYFTNKYPEFETDFTHRYHSFQKEIDSLDRYISSNLNPYQGNKFLIFHPALSYLARDYGLEQISIEIDGKEPTPSNMQEIIKIAKSENIKIIFIQKQFSTHNAEVIAREIDGSVVQIDPLSYNWNESIKEIIDKIIQSYAN
ncbi:MAG: zinc ABC transporter substrate-binding protein [Bacteroidales bacterium]